MGGCVWGILGAGLTFLLALPFWPRGEREGWEELGWAIFTLIACSAVGIAAGAVGIHRALRREDAPDAGLTAVVFVPTAALLLVGGPLVLAAPAAARWMALGLRQWWPHARMLRPAAASPDRVGGRQQRIVLWVVSTLLGMSFMASTFNAGLGGSVGGTAKLWALCGVVPVLLLPLVWRALPALATAALVLGALVVGAAMARTVTADAQPQPERLAQIVREMDPPAGQSVLSRTRALAVRQSVVDVGDAQPVEIVESGPPGHAPSALPPALSPDSEGRLVRVPEVLPADAPAPSRLVAPSAAGLAAAAGWERALRAQGWAPNPPGGGGAANPMDWLPRRANEFLAEHGRQVLGRGLWQRAVVIPFGDGALVVFSTRP